MKKLLTFAGIILLVVVAAIGGIFYERYSKKPAPSEPAKEAKKERKILYYKCPMGQPDYSKHPGKAQCGMDYVPVYEDETGQGVEPDELYIAPEKIQRIGVRSEVVRERALKKVIRTVATVDYDERRLFNINTKVEGWIERLHVNAMGRVVRNGEPLLEIYSPDLVSTQEEYLLALETKKRLGAGALPEAVEGAESILDATRRRLSNWDITEAQVQELEKSGRPVKTMTLHSPVDGVVIEKMALQGMKAMPGEKLFTIADISHVWLNVDVYEYELSLVKPGQKAKVTINAYPGERFSATVSYIYPYLNVETRTARVRLEMNNQGYRLKPGMYANVELEGVISTRAVAVPEDAVLDTGERQAVIIDIGDGRFRVREIEVGLRGEGYYQVLSGLSSGWKVVTSANFLIDSESQFRSAAQSMLGHDHGKADKGTAPDLPAKRSGAVESGLFPKGTEVKPGELDMTGITMDTIKKKPEHKGH